VSGIRYFPVNEQKVGALGFQVLIESSGMLVGDDAVFLAVCEEKGHLDALAQTKGVIGAFPAGAIGTVPASKKRISRV
jgi:hypothetical protein